MSAMTELEQDPKLAAAQGEIQSLEAQIQRYEAQIAVLTDDAAEKRKEAQEAFRAKHAKSFSDINVNNALTGAATVHTFPIGKAKYSIRPPSGEVSRQVQNFMLSPIIKRKVDGKEVEDDIGPLSPVEVFALKWLVSVSLEVEGQPAQVRKLEDLAIPKRLELLRSLNEIALNHIADRAHNLESYLNVCLELELGNFSPTR